MCHENFFQYLAIAHIDTGIISGIVWYITHSPVLYKSKCFSGPKAEILPTYYCRNYCLLLPSLWIFSPCGPHFKATSLSFSMPLSLPPTRVPGSTRTSLSRDAQIWTRSLLRTGCRETMSVCVTFYCEDASKKTKTEKLRRRNFLELNYRVGLNCGFLCVRYRGTGAENRLRLCSASHARLLFMTQKHSLHYPWTRASRLLQSHWSGSAGINDWSWAIIKCYAIILHHNPLLIQSTEIA